MVVHDTTTNTRDVEIHPTAVIDPGVRIGAGTYVGPYCVIRGNTTIGENCYFSSHVSVGDVAEHGTERFEFQPRPKGEIVIEDGVVCREFVTITAPMAERTFIGRRCYIMSKCQVAHDAHLSEEVVLATNVTLGGWNWAGPGAYFGMGVVAHQFTSTGGYAMLAANAFVGKDVPPLGVYVPGKPLRSNWGYVAKKFELDDSERAALVERETSRWEAARRVAKERAGRSRVVVE